MIYIKKAGVEDILGIQEVFYKTWLFTYPNEEAGITKEDVEEKFKDRLSESSIQKRTGDILNMSEKELFLVVRDENIVIGLCRIKKNDASNQLGAIYVLPEYQRKGIGMMLWGEVEKFFGSERDIIVNVATYNTQAINFYKKLGFVDMGKRFTEERYKMPISGAVIPEMELIIKASN